MSQRSLFRDLSVRNNFVCQSCLSTLGKTTSTSTTTARQPWTTIRQNSTEAAQRLKPRSQGRRATRGRTRSQPQSGISLPLGGIDGGGASSHGGAAAALLKDLMRKSNEPTFNFFESNDQGHVKKLQGDEAFSDSLNDTAFLEKEFKQEMAEDMRSLLGEMKKGGGIASMGLDTDALAKEFEAGFGNFDNPEEAGAKLDAYIKKLENQLEAQGQVVDHLESMEDLDFDEDDPEMLMSQTPKFKKPQPIPQIPADTWSYNQRRRIIRLNGVLERVHKEIRRREELTDKTVQSVWKSYSLARQTLAKAWGLVPLGVWDLLWKILSADESLNPNRFTYLSHLARDMSEAKVALNPSQQLITVEALFIEGFEAKAIDNWKRCMSTLGDSGSDTYREFWELGVRMFSQSGDLVQAERAVSKLLEQHFDPRILMPFIRSCAAHSSEEMREKAWESYRRLRDLLGESMGLEEYDQVISMFLATNQTERALFAFVDMMTSGSVDLRGRDRLPSQIGNKFFFGKWLKRLIGAGDFEGAYRVFTFMRSRGIAAATIQINGLVGAWLRNGGSEDVKKAEKLAWDMIKSRIDFVKARHNVARFSGPVEVVEVVAKRDVGPMPKATRETFSILAENYRLRRLEKPMQELWGAFREAEISADAFLLNQLMESHSQFGNVLEARNLYNTFVHERNVKPDTYTFMALWKMLGANRLNLVGQDRISDEVALTRSTFAETVRFAHIFEDGAIDGQLARKVLHTLRRLKDNLGIVIALRAFWKLFKFVPPEVLVLEMAIGTTNLAFDTATSRQKLRLAKRKIDAHVEGRQKRAGQSPVTLDEMTPEQRGEEMSAYLETLYLSEVPGGETRLADVAREMGVYDILAA